MQSRYSDWVVNVRRKHLELTEGDIVPDDLHDWSEEIMSLAGWIFDLSIYIDKDKKGCLSICRLCGDRWPLIMSYAINTNEIIHMEVREDDCISTYYNSVLFTVWY